MTRDEAEAREVELFIGAGRPLLGVIVVGIRALPRILWGAAALVCLLYRWSALPSVPERPAAASSAVAAAPVGAPHGGKSALK